MKRPFKALCAAGAVLVVPGAVAAQNDPWTPDSWDALRAQLVAHSDATGDPLSAVLIRPDQFETDIEIASAYYLERSSMQNTVASDVGALSDSFPVIMGSLYRIYFRDQVQSDGQVLRRVRSTYRADCEGWRIGLMGSTYFADVAGENRVGLTPFTLEVRWEDHVLGSEFDIALKALCDGQALYDPAG
ncbi:MAG: hypothetical protein AAFX09_08470 [Pseudomonadota bacterium]